MERILRPISGYLMLLLGIICFGLGIYMLVSSGNDGLNSFKFFGGLFLVLAGVFFVKGITIVNPNQSVVCTFFGKYVGTIKDNGLLFVNPFFARQRISLR